MRVVLVMIQRFVPRSIERFLVFHWYVSTACFHNLHGQCRKTCKFCRTKCRCYCHDKPDTTTS